MYYLFTYDNYHAHGGFRDFAGKFDSMLQFYNYLKAGVKINGNEINKDIATWDDFQIIEITDNGINVIISDIYIDDYIENANPVDGTYEYPKREGNENKDNRKWLVKKLNRANAILFSEPPKKIHKKKSKKNIQTINGL